MNITIPAETLTRGEIRVFEAERQRTKETMLEQKMPDLIIPTTRVIVLTERRYKIEEYIESLKEAILQCQKAQADITLPGDKTEEN